MSGHQVVELPSLDRIISLNPEDGMARSILAWIAFLLTKEASSKELGIRVDLITVEYISSYPALGVFYLLEEVEDQEDWVLIRGEEILSNFSLDVFGQFLQQFRVGYLSVLERGENSDE